jgi:hypothetical protein
MVTAWADLFLRVTGVCLASQVPLVIFFALMVAKRVKPTPVVIAAGLGACVFVTAVILLPMDPRSGQYRVYDTVALALFLGLLTFLSLLATYALQSLFWERPDPEEMVKRVQSRFYRLPGVRAAVDRKERMRHMPKAPPGDKQQG